MDFRDGTTGTSPIVILVLINAIVFDHLPRSVGASDPLCEVPTNETIQWVIDTCIENSTLKVSKCFSPKGLDLNCIGIKNSEECSKAAPSIKLPQNIDLLTFDESSFYYNAEQNLLCWHPKIGSTSDVESLFGFDLDVEFFRSESEVEDKVHIHLGAIYPSGVPNQQQLEETLICVSAPDGKGWHFHAVGFSIPMEQGADRTIQSDKPTIESLRRISLDGPTFAVDQFNQSKPTIRFPEDLCKEPDKERNKLVTFIAASIISVSVLLIFLSFLALVLCSNCPRNKNEQNNSLQNGKGTKTDSGYVPSELLNEDTGMADNNPEGNEESSL